MAYVFVISLNQTMHRLLNSKDIIIESRAQEILKFACQDVISLKLVLERMDHRNSSSSTLAVLNDSDGEIRAAVCRLEDLLDTHLFNQYFPSNGDEKKHPIQFSPGLQELKEHVNSLTQILRKLCLFHIRKGFLKAWDVLTDAESKLKTILLSGWRTGKGKTIIAKEIFEDVHISELFDCRVWVTLGQKNELKEIAVAILSQIHPASDLNKEGDDEDIDEYLKECLKGRRYLIVLDDIDYKKDWNYLKRIFPDDHNGSRVLLLATISMKGAQVDHEICIDYLSDELESWENEVKIAEKGGTYFKQITKEIFGNTKDLQVSNLLINVNAISSTTDFSVKKSEMVKLSDEVAKIKDTLLRGPLCSQDYSCQGSLRRPIKEVRYASKFGVVSLVGMAGIGKTTLAKEVFEDPSILDYFDLCVWVTLGPEYQLGSILARILSQVNPGIDINEIDKQIPQELASRLYKSLKGMKYLIVLDDIWIIESFTRFMNMSFPDESNGSRVLLTARLRRIALFTRNSTVHHKRFLNEEESWQLLHQKVFGQGSCHSELEKAGKKIAKSCEGLPLTIVTVANILSKEEKTVEYWNKVAEKKNSVFNDAYDQMLKVLYPSYNYLLRDLKTCFLYMGVFPQTYKIPLSKLINLWGSKEFLVPELSISYEDFVLNCLEDLDSRSLLMVHRKNYNHQIKTCWLHSAFWHLSINEAEKNKFFHHLNRFVDGLSEGMKGQRRLCVHSNILFGIKDVQDAMASTSTARSLLCAGPYHQYPVPICFSLILLRVLDALTVRFNEFPVEVVKLFQLRYLALTCNGTLPPSISKLFNLEFLIVHRHLSIKTPGDWAHLPAEIWDMKALKHLQVMGSNLPEPCDIFLLNLLTLSNVNLDSCTEVGFKQIPNLKKLGIQIELAPDAAEPLGYLNCISHLCKLESLKCVVVNPELKSEIVALPAPLSMFPSSLTKLSLSGFGYPWEYMTTIALLPNLDALKLRCFAFQGPEWVTKNGEFKRLRYLLIEDTDLVCWRADAACCAYLDHLIIRHCYKLKEIPSQSLRHVKKIDIVCCDPSISTQMEEDEEEI